MIGSDWIRTEALDSCFDAFSLREPVSTSLENALCDLAREEVTDQRHHFVKLVFEGEMAGVDEMKFGLGKVALVGMCAVRGENEVVLAPDDQRRRLMFAEIGLHRRIKRKIGPVIVEEIELDVVVARPIEQCLIVH